MLIRPTPGASSLRSNSNVELIAAADVHLADPDLRHAGASADLGDHLRAPGVVGVRREGRVLTVLSKSGSEAVIEEATRFGPVSTDVLPVTLKEIFLESVAIED